MFIASISISIYKSEPLSLGEGMALMVAILIVTFLAMGVGAYIFIRVLAGVINGRRDIWERAAAELGLAIDHSSGAINKDMTGVRDGRSIRISRYAVPRGESSYDQYAAVEVSMELPLNFSFEITRPEMFYQKVASFFSEDTSIGHEPFDKAFLVETSDTPLLLQLLNAEMLEGENSNLIGDLMAARKKYHRVKATDKTITLGVRAELDDTSPIGPTLEKAIYIAGRFEKAAANI